MYDIDSLRREEFPFSADLTYLNHAGISPLPQRTQQAVTQATKQLATNPSRYWFESIQPELERMKAALTAFIRAESPEEIVPIGATGIGLNAFAQALTWQPGENVVFSEFEFPSNAFPWLSLQSRNVATCMVKGGAGLTLDDVREVATDRTRVVAVSSVQFFTGHRTDLAAIGRFCRDNGILFVVDTIQSIGHIEIDVQAMNIDVVASGGQKSILGLPGLGFMYVRGEVAEGLRPSGIGSTSTSNFLHWLDYDLTPLPAAGRFSAGTPNALGYYAITSSLTLLEELGVANIDRHTTALSRYLIDCLTERGYAPITPRDEVGPIVTFPVDLTAVETDALVSALREQRIEVVKHLDRGGAPYVRVSFHCYNTTDEVDYFVMVVDNLLRSL